MKGKSNICGEKEMVVQSMINLVIDIAMSNAKSFLNS